MKTAAAYIRVSTEDQTEYSPDAQLKRIREYASSHDILLLPDQIYMELGVSGRKAERRPKFLQLMAVAKRKPRPFDAVLIHAFDRFARSVKDSRIYKELLRDDLGIDLISITEDFGGGKNSFLMESIKDVMNEYYSLNLRDEVLKGMTEKASRGELQSSPPYGYKVENGKLVIVPEEAENIREIFRCWNNGDGAFKLARMLNDLGARTHRGHLWETRNIRYILANPAYIGKLRWTPGRRKREEFQNENSIVADAEHEAIIDMDTFDAAQRRAEEVKASHTHKQRPETEYGDWLSSLVKCASCGGSLSFCKSIKYQYMTCHNYAKGTCKDSQRIKTEVMHRLFIERLSASLTQQDINIAISATTSNDDDKKVLCKTKDALTSRLERYKSAYLNGVETLDDYKVFREQALKEIARLDALITATPELSSKYSNKATEIDKHRKDALAVLTSESSSINDKVKAIRTTVHHAVYDRSEHRLTIFYLC